MDQAVDSNPLQRWAPALVIGFVVLVVLAAFVVSRGSGSHALTGEIYLQDSGYLNNVVGRNCVGRGSKANVTTNAPVQIKDQKGTIVGSGSIEQGTVIAWDEFLASTDAAGYDGRMEAPAACKFKLSVGSVGDADVYSVEVGNRVLVTATKADLADSDWNLNFMDGWTLRK
jgi:hypothetical protein